MKKSFRVKISCILMIKKRIAYPKEIARRDLQKSLKI
jgi:hypothetical protein